MRNTLIIKKIVFVFALLIIVSCEDVIEVQTPSEEPRLIVDALIRVDLNDPLFETRIKVSQTDNFFGSIPPANLNQITLFNFETNELVVLLEEGEGSGVYSKITGTDFLTSGRIVLQIDWQDELFIAFTEFKAAPPINSITQGDGTFIDDDDTEIIINFTDIAEEDNFYLFDFGFDEFLATEDTFYQDQEFEFSHFYDDPIDPGTELEVSIMGMDKDFYDYMDLLIEQSGQQDFGVFATPSVTVRGNIFNGTEIDNIDFFNNLEMTDNFPLGYFAIVQENKFNITITDD